MSGSMASFLVTLFLIFATLPANLHVQIDSSKSWGSGDIVAIILVLQLPPKLSFKMSVMSESRYGMCTFSPCAYRFKQSITSSKKCRLRLMPTASFCNIPSTPVFPILSLPLRSTRQTFETVFTSEAGFLHSKIMMKMQWDLVEASFFGVSAITRFCSPMKRRLRASSSD